MLMRMLMQSFAAHKMPGMCTASFLVLCVFSCMDAGQEKKICILRGNTVIQTELKSSLKRPSV